ncbi:MAG: AI-2E family transporter [Alistipes sp.]|nr:AI-2E family transporter [Alistipes sp.]
MDKKEFKRYIIIAAIFICSILVIQNLSLVGTLASIALQAMYPLLLGIIIAYVSNIILSFFEAHYFPKKDSKFFRYSRRPVCVILSFLSVFVTIALVLNIVIPELISAIKLITAEIPPFIIKGRDYVIEKFNEYPDIQKQVTDLFNEFDFKELDWATITDKAAAFVEKGVMGLLTSAFGLISVIAGTVTNIVLAVIFAIYLLLRKDKLLRDINRLFNLWFNQKINSRIQSICQTANETFKSFFIGQFVEAILLGCLCFIGMTILQLPYAAMSGTLVGVTALIPIVGAFLGAGISAFIILTESPMQALVFLIFLVILQQLEGNLIYPKVVGNSIGLPGIWVLAAVTLGGGLWGIPGMLLGVPLAATIYKISFEQLESKEKELGIEPPPEEPEKEKKAHIPFKLHKKQKKEKSNKK